MANSSILFGLTVAAAIFCTVLCIPYQEPPYGRKLEGYFTYNRGNAKGACGKDVSYETDMIVAVNCSYWKTFPSGNPNLDPICENTCLDVTKGSKTIQVRVVDQCCGCGTDHIDLSVAAYKALEPDMTVGEVKGVTWVFKHCDGSAATSSKSANGSNSPSNSGKQQKTDRGNNSKKSTKTQQKTSKQTHQNQGSKRYRPY